MNEISIKRLAEKEIDNRGIKTWPVWEKEISRFPWTYSDNEECLIIEGEFLIETKDGIYNVEAGDFVTFPKGLNCVWDIKKPVKKYYNFP